MNDKAIQDVILHVLEPADPMDERTLQIKVAARLHAGPEDLSIIRRNIHQLQIDNKIRWVFMRGWAKGGRPL